MLWSLPIYPYQEGVEGDEHTISLEDVETLYREREHDASFSRAARIWEYVCWWCDKAYQAGKETAQHR